MFFSRYSAMAPAAPPFSRSPLSILLLLSFLSSLALSSCDVAPWRPVSASWSVLSLRGGKCTGSRGTVKQRPSLCPRRFPRKNNYPLLRTIRPCTGPRKLSALERYHGKEVVRDVLWQASPRSVHTDPATIPIRIGFRSHMWESIRPFKPKKSMDINAKLIAVVKGLLGYKTDEELQACVKGVRHIVEHLLQTGADINYLVQPKTGVHKDYIGFTPLSAAAHCGHTSLVKLLLQQGADIKCGREKDPIGKAKFWFALSNMVGDKKIETRKALYAKISPFYGNNRRNPGKRKTRHPKGQVGKHH